MKKGCFLWSAHRITEKQKAGKAGNIKEKQLKNSRNTVSKLHVVRLSSPRDNFLSQDNSIRITTPQDFGSEEFFWLFVKSWGKFRNWRFAWDWRISNMSAAWRAQLLHWLTDRTVRHSVIRKSRITAADGKTYNTNHYNWAPSLPWAIRWIQRFKTACGMSGDLSCSLTWSLTKLVIWIFQDDPEICCCWGNFRIICR